MYNYFGCVCDVCGGEFNKESDVVVCPECGTPHHRECWKNESKCVNHDKHSDGFEWVSPFEGDSPSTTTPLCPKCNKQNPKDASFCEVCGTSLSLDNTKPSTISPTNSGGVVSSFAASILEGEIDGVSYKDMSIYIGSSAPYYIFKFKRMQKKQKAYKPFCWSACLLAPLYFFYRRMWGYGLLFGGINLFLNLPSIVLQSVQMGFIPADTLTGFAGLESTALTFSFIMLLLNVLWGFLAIHLFRKKIISDLKKYKKDAATNEEYYETITAKAGPSTAVFVIGIAFAIFSLFGI